MVQHQEVKPMRETAYEVNLYLTVFVNNFRHLTDNIEPIEETLHYMARNIFHILRLLE